MNSNANQSALVYITIFFVFFYPITVANLQHWHTSGLTLYGPVLAEQMSDTDIFWMLRDESDVEGATLQDLVIFLRREFDGLLLSLWRDEQLAATTQTSPDRQILQDYSYLLWLIENTVNAK